MPARLETVSTDWRLGFQIQRDGQWTSEELPASRLVRWGRLVNVTPPQRTIPHLMHAPAVLVLLNDDSLLSGYVLAISDDHLQLDSDLLGELALPLTQVQMVMFQAPQDAAAREKQIARWLTPDAEVAGKSNSDRLILANGDQLPGTLTALETNNEEEPHQLLRWKAELGTVEVPLDQAAAIVFNPALISRPRFSGPSAWIGLDDGSYFRATGMTMAGTTARFERPGGLKFSARARDVVFLQPLDFGIRYVSDLPVGGYRHLPFLTIEWPYRRDRTVLGTALRSGGETWLKGLGMHSAARISFALDRSYSRLAAELAIDKAGESRGSVRFRVFLDGKEAYTSPIVRGGEPPLPMDVPLQGAKRIDLVIDFAEEGDVCDYADWLDLRLLP